MDGRVTADVVPVYFWCLCAGHGTDKEGLMNCRRCPEGDMSGSLSPTAAPVSLRRTSRKYLIPTKPDRSGMGLAISYAVVRNHEGNILVESDPGKGTVFPIYLPAKN